MLKLATLPNRCFDQKKVIYNVLDQAKLIKFEHKEDEFDDLFSSAESIFQVQEIAKIRYHDEGLVEFNKLREQSLQTLPLDLLATAPMIQSSEPEQQLTHKPPATSKISKEVQRREQEELQRKEQEEAKRKQQEEEAQRIRDQEQERKQEQSSKKVNVDT